MFSNQRPNAFLSNGYGNDFSKDLDKGYVIHGGENSTSYMGTELIDFLKRPVNGGPKDNSESSNYHRNPMLDQAYSFNYMIGDGASNSITQPGSQTT